MTYAEYVRYFTKTNPGQTPLSFEDWKNALSSRELFFAGNATIAAAQATLDEIKRLTERYCKL